jgi:hypothetical protein
MIHNVTGTRHLNAGNGSGKEMQGPDRAKLARCIAVWHERRWMPRVSPPRSRDPCPGAEPRAFSALDALSYSDCSNGPHRRIRAAAPTIPSIGSRTVEGASPSMIIIASRTIYHGAERGCGAGWDEGVRNGTLPVRDDRAKQ